VAQSTKQLNNSEFIWTILYNMVVLNQTRAKKNNNTHILLLTFFWTGIVLVLFYLLLAMAAVYYLQLVVPPFPHGSCIEIILLFRGIEWGVTSTELIPRSIHLFQTWRIKAFQHKQYNSLLHYLWWKSYIKSILVQ